MILTLEEAIAREEGIVAENERFCAVAPSESAEAYHSATYHRQIAEWLKEVRERKTGKWITEQIGTRRYATKCSVCGTTLHEGHGFGNAKEYTEYINEFCMLDKFCHECGTKMEADG